MTKIEQLELDRLLAILDRDYRKERELAAEIQRAESASLERIGELWPGAIMPDGRESGYHE